MKSDHDFLAGGGEMGERLRRFDWQRTELGPASSWPGSLRSAISIVLGSRYPMFVWWGKGLIKFYNDAYIPVLGARHPDALGREARKVWSEIWDVLGPQTEIVLRSGEATWNDRQLLVMERNGYTEETYFSWSYSPVREESGAVNGVFCACTEDTERVLGERRLRTLSDLGAGTPEEAGVQAACDAAARQIGGNPHDIPFAAVYLLENATANARLAAGVRIEEHGDILAPELALASPLWPLAQAAATGEAQIVQGLSRLKHIASAPWPEPVEQAIVLPLPAAERGASAGFFIAGISARRRLDPAYRGFLDLVAGHIAKTLTGARAYELEKRRAESLAEIDRAKTAFFSNVSHEFRTPLTLMLGPVGDLLARPDTRNREELELVRRNGLRLQKLVNTLLDFSRIEAGRAQASYVPTDVAALTADLASSFRSAVEKAGLKLVVDCPRLARPAYVDHDMWEKIVLNLLSNAFKFTFEGEISIALRQKGNRFELAVRDTGTGIPAAELPHIFERFRRVAGAKSRTHEGTGIGLALVQELVKLHGGEVSVDSVEGRGSMFRVSIPAGKAHLPAERIGALRTLAPTALGAESFVQEAMRWLPGEAAALPDPEGRRERIVWADDNADMREYVRRLLSGRYEVEAVADGEAALAAVHARRPDLVLTDVMMPKLDGLGLIRALRADPQMHTIPTIALSARAGEEGQIEGRDAGADDYIVKPFSARDLLARVSACLEMARIRRAAEQALRDADQRKDEFMAMLAHELRNPLSAIALGADLLKRAKLDDPKARFAAPAIERQVKQLQRLADDMLDMARATYGKLTLKKERIHLLETAKAVAALHARTHKSAKIEVAGELAWVEGDATRVQQMIGNLIENALKYGGRKIKVRVRRKEAWGRLSVQDDGQGIVPELLPELFKPFVQGTQPLERAQGGLGLGLALVSRLAALHGGSVEAQSEGPGKGSTFTISLPATQGPARGKSKTPSVGGEQKRRVLVVEDEKDVREMLRFLLESEGHEVSIADNGVDGLAQLDSFHPDVALVDIGLPRMDGYEVARRARLLPGGKGIRLIAISGYGQEKDRQRSRDAGFDLHVTKPVGYDQLVRAFKG